jgi:hypothetical protein
MFANMVIIIIKCLCPKRISNNEVSFCSHAKVLQNNIIYHKHKAFGNLYVMVMDTPTLLRLSMMGYMKG